MAAGTLTVEVLDEGVHSGDASGVVPSQLPHPARSLLSRLEDEATGEIMPAELYAQIPPERVRAGAGRRPRRWATRSTPSSRSPAARGRWRTTRPSWCSTAPGGRSWRSSAWPACPLPGNAGNVLRPYTTAKLSLRLPPTLDAGSGRRRRCKAAAGSRPALRRQGRVLRLAGRVGRVERAGLGAVAGSLAGQGARRTPSARRPPIWAKAASIPFMGMLGETFPQAQFVITGVLGPHSNAHGPNEFLHIPTGQKNHPRDRANARRPSCPRAPSARSVILRRPPWRGGRPDTASPARQGC